MRRPHSEETKRKISETKQGRKLTTEHRAKISEAGRGRVHSEETRQKIADGIRGKKHSPERSATMSAARKGKVPWAAVYASARANRGPHPPDCPHCIRLREERAKKRLPEEERVARRKATNRASTLKARYGITIDEYNSLLKQQNGVCAICGHKCETGKNLAVDHDHETGLVRGLLCRRCNRGIGHFRTTQELEAALTYLGVGCS